MAAIRPSQMTKNHGELGGDTTIINCTVIAGGFFEALQQVIVAGWDPTSDVAKKLDRSWMDSRLLLVNEKETKQIKLSMGRALIDMQKFHDMCAY